jgi:hypothetical protein
MNTPLETPDVTPPRFFTSGSIYINTVLTENGVDLIWTHGFSASLSLQAFCRENDDQRQRRDTHCTSEVIEETGYTIIVVVQREVNL